MKKVCSIAAVLSLCALVFLIPSVTAQAYDEESCYVNEAGDWEVDSADGPGASVSMYMMVQPDLVNSAGFRDYYWFWCEEGLFNYKDGRHDTSAGMIYFFRAENKDVVEEYNGTEIWYWNFKIEPGVYEFAFPTGSGNVTILPSSFGSPFIDDGYTEAETMTVEEGDNVHLYTMYGEWEWRKQDEQLKALMDYAKMREDVIDKNMNPYKVEEHGETVTIEVEGEEEPAPVKEKEVKKTPAPEVPKATLAPTEEKKNGGGWIAGISILVIAVIIAIGSLIFVKKKDK